MAPLLSWLLCLLLLFAPDVFTAAREKMVREQIESRGIRNADLLRALRATPRHLFVPPEVRSQAYEDHPVPIGYAATISQPFIVAEMTRLLEPAKNHRVLEIGTGSGYQAAILAQLVKHVYTIEIVPELAKSAAKILGELGYANVTVRQGDGYQGWPDQAPFERIILTAAPHDVPQTLLDQLARGGKLVAPVGSGFGQELVVIDKNPDGKLRRRSAGAVAFVPMVRK